jgi:hypothetical protein
MGRAREDAYDRGGIWRMGTGTDNKHKHKQKQLPLVWLKRRGDRRRGKGQRQGAEARGWRRGAGGEGPLCVAQAQGITQRLAQAL